MFLYMYMHACTLYCIFNVSVKCWKIKMGYIPLKSCMYLGKELTPHGVRLNAPKVNRYLSFFGKT